MTVPGVVRRYWPNAALVAQCAVVFVALFHLGIALEMDRTYFSFRYLGQGQVAAAVGSLVPGEPRDHMLNTAIMDLATQYWTTEHDVPLHTIVEEARQKIAARDGGGRGWVLDDKGYVDWLRVAFQLFGLHKRSVYYTYFIILGTPMCIYAAYFFRRRAHLFGLLAVLVAFYVTAPILTVNDQLYSLHEQRFFGAVGIAPLLTVLFVMSEATFTLPALLVVICQVAALVFVYFCRNDAIWQTLSVAAAVPLFCWRLRGRFPDRWRLARRVAWPLAILVVGLLALEWYKHATFNRAYYSQGYASHAYSHNLAMGLSYNPRLAREYDLAVDDVKVIMLVGRHMMVRGELTSANDALAVFNSDFNRYGAEVRAALWDLVKTHPGESALSFAYKIGPVIDEFLYIAGYREDNPAARRAGHTLASPATRQQRELYYRPWRWTALIALGVAALLAYGASTSDWRTARLVVTLVFLGSLTVPLAVLPMMYLMGPTFVAAPLALYVVTVSTVMILAARLPGVAVRVETDRESRS